MLRASSSSSSFTDQATVGQHMIAALLGGMVGALILALAATTSPTTQLHPATSSPVRTAHTMRAPTFVASTSRPVSPFSATPAASADTYPQPTTQAPWPKPMAASLAAQKVAGLIFAVIGALTVAIWHLRKAGGKSAEGVPFVSMTSVAGKTVDLEVDALIVGSGISGSSTAHHLVRNRGVERILLAERNPVVGGNVISKARDGFVWDEGPNSFQPTPAIMRTVHELGITEDLVLADGSLPRFVYWEGRGAGAKLANLHALPTNLPGDLLTFNLLTLGGKLRAGIGAVGLISPPPPLPYEESIREFVTRHLGEETFERVIDPFVSGVYAGDPDQLAMRSALKKIHRLEGLGDFGPGLVSGAINRFKEIAKEKKENPPDPAWPTYKGGQLGSFRLGLQTLPNAVASELGEDRVKTSWTLVGLERPGPHFLATFETPEGIKTVKAKAVTVTAPTRVTSKVCAPLVPAAARLAEVYSPPVASVTMAYKKEWFRELPGAKPGKPLVGFGHLLPRSMGVRSLGTIWSSSLFPGRAPEGWELLLTYIGGSRDKGIADMTEEAIVKQVDADNHQILLKPDAPAGQLVGCRVWQQAIPQYCRGHADILAALEADEKQVPGLYLGGNYRTGVAFGDCVQFGLDEAARVASYLKEC